MNADILKGKWKQLRGSVKGWWGRLTDDDLEQIDGLKDRLIGRVQERYGYAREEAAREVERRLDDWARALEQ